MVDLWPNDIGEECGSSSALTILKEQAVNLGNKTGNILKAEVRGRADINKRRTSQMYFDFNIIAPLLQNYKYRLLQVAIDIDNLYPIEIFVDDEMFRELGFENEEGVRKPIIVQDEFAFNDMLRRIFDTRITRSIVRNLRDFSREPDSE